jgi:hypothetical protein
MRSMATILGLVVALGGGYVVYDKYMTRTNLTQTPPQEQIDVIGIRAGLLSIGQAERLYLVTHGNYGTLDQIRQENPTIATDQRGYVISLAVDGSGGFTATATPVDANKANWPTLTMDETMQVVQR